MVAPVEEVYWDPYDAELDKNPYEVWRRLRDEFPVYRNDKHDFWALSRFADVQAASHNSKTFSSSHGTVLEYMGNHFGDMEVLIFMDPPAHTALRALISRAFTPKRTSAMEDRIRAICGKLLDPHVGSSGFDYVRDFAQQLPSMVISSMLGVPESENEEVRLKIDEIFHIDPQAGMMNEISINARLWIRSYILNALDERRKNPQDDMFTALTQAELSGEEGVTRKLTDDEAADFGGLLVTAGTETVARLLGWAAVTFPKHRDQLRLMAEDHSRIPGAVEELLRYEAPSPVQGRWTLNEVEMHGTVVPAESKVLLLTGSAGRDERQYPDADKFDITRDPKQHVSLGIGAHYCLGAALARLEGRIALQETVRRFRDWDADISAAVQVHTSTVRGWSSVPITL
ncbi:cytochrome [Mycobacterium paraffinicum]|uniref:Cytochrome n=1 Tax=Mycobacterium paraffinicum TaxID=53378 RepID=A0A1Q4I299_9MYCO|nr:cytochrome P450 [Mycobacterium paraffinicum]OJZ76102.1 cytochrome [Mycobacterium paraffinicum]